MFFLSGCDKIRRYNPDRKQQEVRYRMFIEDIIFIHILDNTEDKTGGGLNKISHRETTEPNMGRPTLI